MVGVDIVGLGVGLFDGCDVVGIIVDGTPGIGAGVGGGVGLRVDGGGGFVGKLVGFSVLLGDVFTPVHPLQSHAPTVKRSLSKKRSLHLSKLSRFGRVKSKSSGSYSPSQLAIPFQTASHGVEGINLPRAIMNSLVASNGRGYSPKSRPPLIPPPRMK